MNKVASFLYGITCYLVFLYSFLYLVGFVVNIIVPKSIDSGIGLSSSESLVIDIALLSLFAVQHTIMARPAFKRWWTTMIPVQVERSTFVLIASLLLLLLCWQWRPITGVIWNIENETGQVVLTGLCWLGWGTVLFSSFIINHFDLFGLRQVWLHLRSAEYHHVEFQTKSLYHYLRQPMMLGFIVAFWTTPHMTAGHLLFAAGSTIYILIGIQFEEHDLVDFLGSDYDDYRNRVPMLLPFGKRKAQISPTRKHASQ